jgi:hypothetical protein
MTTARDSLPERNEDYATREYWYAHLKELFFSYFFPDQSILYCMSGMRDMHSEVSELLFLAL